MYSFGYNHYSWDQPANNGSMIVWIIGLSSLRGTNDSTGNNTGVPCGSSSTISSQQGYIEGRRSELRRERSPCNLTNRASCVSGLLRGVSSIIFDVFLRGTTMLAVILGLAPRGLALGHEGLALGLETCRLGTWRFEPFADSELLL